MALLAIPELDQGSTDNCGVFAAADVLAHFGLTATPIPQIYQAIHGHAMPPSDNTYREQDLCTADQVASGLQRLLGAAYLVRTVFSLWEVLNAAGISPVIVPVQMADLIAGQQYFHFLVLRGLTADGAPVVSDSYRAHDHGPDTYTPAAFAKAVKDGPSGPWGIIVDRKATAPTPPAPSQPPTSSIKLSLTGKQQLHLRAGPSTTFPIVAIYEPNELLAYTEEHQGPAIDGDSTWRRTVEGHWYCRAGTTDFART